MLKPSDFNSAVPQFQNGNYASNPVNPQYIAEPSSTEYNRGAEPLQTLPAQWWNWFMNKFTSRFNKVNIYVKNIFNELSELLGVVQLSPDGTEGSPTISQLKTMFCSCYPNFIRDSDAIADAYVKQTTTVNGHALSGNVSVTRADLGLGNVATLNTGTASGCVPLVGSAMGTTNNNIVVTDVNGALKPSGTVIGSAAGYDCSCFRPSTWTPSSVTCASTISRTGYTDAYNFDVLLTNGSSTANGTTPYVSNKCRLQFCSTTGVLSAVCFNGLATRAGYATCLYNRPGSVANGLGNVYFYTGCTNANCVATNFGACICGADGCLYGLGGINLGVTCTTGCKSVAIGSSACTDGWSIYGCVGGSDQYNLIMNLTDDGNNYIGFACQGTVKSYICGSDGKFYGNVCGNVSGSAGSVACATDSAKLTGKLPSALCVACAGANGSGTAFGSSAVKNTGNASGCIPTIGTTLGSTANLIVLTDSNGMLKPSPYIIGNSAYKTAGSALGNVPVIGAPLGTTNNNIVVTDTTGYLKPSGIVLGSASGCDASAFLAYNGCATDSARLQGKTITCIWDECVPHGFYGNVAYSCMAQYNGLRQWSLCTTALVSQCDVYKAFNSVLNDFCGQNCVSSTTSDGNPVWIFEAPVQGVFRDHCGYHYATHIRRDWICCGGTSIRPVRTPAMILIDCTNPSSVYCSQTFCCVKTTSACLCSGSNVSGHFNFTAL